jgi:hypothetical protein
MGIKNLNRFLMDNCSKKSIKKIHLSYLRDKKIVIDTSIYLYKFTGDNALIENMYLLISILKKYDIIPIFVFDGKPPLEKKQLLIQRRNEKIEAEQKYLEIQKLMEENISEEKKEEVTQELETLKKQFIRIKDEDILKVKELMDAYGVTYYEAEGEADILCCQLINSGEAWGCISDDMDMFLYGCNHVLRHLSLLNHTLVHYNNEMILKDLKMSEKTFREIMVISGTDYNIKTETNLYETIKWFYEYNKYLANNDIMKDMGFYDWLLKHTRYIKNYEELIRISKMFQLENYKNCCNITSITEEKKINMEKIQKIMENEGFIFV